MCDRLLNLSYSLAMSLFSGRVVDIYSKFDVIVSIERHASLLQFSPCVGYYIALELWE